MSFPERIEAILKHYSLSPRELSHKIEVQRSNISHLLSGRNKPSVAFLTKLSETFPDLSMHWLLHGKGEMITNVITNVTTPKSISSTPSETLINTDNTESQSRDQNPNISKQDGSTAYQKPRTDKVLTKIICVYSDGSTEVFSPDHSG